jgi:hypothetical protein
VEDKQKMNGNKELEISVIAGWKREVCDKDSSRLVGMPQREPSVVGFRAFCCEPITLAPQRPNQLSLAPAVNHTPQLRMAINTVAAAIQRFSAE